MSNTGEAAVLVDQKIEDKRKPQMNIGKAAV